MKRSGTAMMTIMMSLFYAAFCQAQIVESAQLNVERRAHTATLLNDGKVLIVGGDNQNGFIAQTEVFDPVAQTASLAASLANARTDHSATKLADGRVLIIGGRGPSGALTSTEIFDPLTATFNAGPSMTTPRSGHSATVLGDGRILVAGGDMAGSAELYNPLSQSFSLVTGSLNSARRLHSAIVANTGQVLIVGGVNAQNAVLNTAEVFDPASQSFYMPPTDLKTPRALATLKLLADGKVQIIGGDSDSTMEVFDAQLGWFNALALLPPTVDSLAATLSTQSRAALISPTISQDQFLQGALTADHLALLDRADHSITELPAQNKALVAGGVNSTGQILSSATLVNSASASVTTDQTDYAPGSIVTITGRGFQSNESVAIILHETPEGYPDLVFVATADGQGNFTSMQFSPQTIDVGRTFLLTAVGQTSGYTAQTAFTDGTPSITNVTNSPFSPNQASSVTVKDTTVITARNQGSGSISDFRIRIHAGTVSGTLVRQFLFTNVAQNTNVTATWDGKDTAGNFVADGTYIAAAANGTTETTSPATTLGTIVVDNTNPTVALSSPADNAFVSSTISLEAIPLDDGGNDSNIDRVEFYVDAVLRGVDSNSGGGWKTNVNTATLLSDGDHTWFAKAFDKAGNNATSSSRTIKVDNTAPMVTVVPVSNVFVGISKAITGTSSDLPALAGYGVASVQVTIRRTSDNTVLATGLATNTGTNFSTWSFSYTPTEVSNQNVAASATDNAGNAGNSTAQNFTVNLQKATPVITFAAAPAPTFGGANFTVSATTTNTDSSALTYSKVSGPCAVVNGSTGEFSSSAAGTCVVKASGVETTNFLAASVDQSVTIAKAATVTTVICGVEPFTYNGGPHTPCSATVTGPGGLNEALTVNYTDNTNAGAATASASYAESANYLGSTDSKNFTISKAGTVTTVTCGAGPFTYNGTPHTPCSATVTGPGGLSQVLTVNYTDNTNAGTATASASYAESTNYLGSTDSKNFTIAKAPTVTAVSCPASVTYNGSAQTPCTALVTGVGLSQALTVNYTDNTNAGTATASASYAESTNYLGSTDSKTFKIAKAPSVTVVSFEPGPYIYRGTAFTATALVTGVGGLNQTVAVVYSGDCTNVTVTNGCTATANFTGDANHIGSSDSKGITITKASSTTLLTFEAGPYMYRGTAFTATAAVTGAGGLNQTVAVVYSGECTLVTVINGCTATATFAGDANHTGSSDSKSITITTAFAFSGFYSPIGGSFENGDGGSYADPVRAFKLGSTIPVKFGASWLNGGAALLTGIHTLQAFKYSSATDSEPPIDATPTDAATSGNEFRLSGTDWHFNLSTKGNGFAAGTWLLKATLVDGSTHTVWITIKK